MTDSAKNEPLDDPEVMFLPLATRPSSAWRDLDAGVFARRIPDFLHQVLNQGQVGPSAMLELQSTAAGEPATWVQMDTAPSREEAFDLLPADLEVLAVVTGDIAPTEGGLEVEFHVEFGKAVVQSRCGRRQGMHRREIAGLQVEVQRVPRFEFAQPR